MPNISLEIDVALSGNGLDADLSLQGENLGAILDTVKSLVDDPLTEIKDFLFNLESTGLPSLSASTEFQEIFSSLENLLPEDLSSISGDLLDELGELPAKILELIQLLEKTLNSLKDLFQIAESDLLCGAESVLPPPLIPLSTLTSLSAARSRSISSQSSPVLPPDAPVGSNFLHQISSSLHAIDEILDILPSPFTIPSFLDWLFQFLTNAGVKEMELTRSLGLDQLVDTLETLVYWQTANTQEILDHIIASIEGMDTLADQSFDEIWTPIDDQIAGVSPLLAGLPIDSLSTSLKDDLISLGNMINTGDLTAVNPLLASINASLDQFELFQSDFADNQLPEIEALQSQVEQFSRTLSQFMGRLIGLVDVQAPFEDQFLGLSQFLSPPTDLKKHLEGYSEIFSTIESFFDKINDVISPASLEGPAQTIITQIEAIGDQFDTSLTTATLKIQDIFADLNQQIEGIDLSAIIDQLQEDIDNFVQSLIDDLSEAFATVNTAISEQIEQVDTSLDNFSPEAIIDALRSAIEGIADVLSSPDVLGKIEKIQAAIQQVIDAIESLSFTPVTDVVIDQIDEVSGTLSTIEESELNPVLKTALQAALAILPESIQPLTDPLIDEFDELVQAGPVTLLDRVKEEPEKLLEKIESFQPAALIAEPISEPFQSLIQQLEAFHPSQLITPVEEEFDRLSQRLTDQLDPEGIVEPVQQIFEQLISQLDELNPEAIIAPINDLLQEGISSLTDALDFDEITGILNQLIAYANTLLDPVNCILNLLQRAIIMLTAFDDPTTEVNNWLSTVLANLDGITDTSSVQPILDQLNTSLNNLRANSLTNRANASFDTVRDTLDALTPLQLQLDLIEAYNGISAAAIDALPDSPEKTAIQTALGRFNPLDVDFGKPFTALEQLRESLHDNESERNDAFSVWDDTYFFAGGPLDSLQSLQASPTALRQWIGDAIQTQLAVPFTKLFETVFPYIEVLQATLEPFGALGTKMQETINQLTSGPQALLNIQSSWDQALDRLKAVNLDILADGVNSLFDTIKSELDSISPASIIDSLAEVLTTALSGLTSDLIIDPSLSQDLDDIYSDLLDKLKALDPEILVVEIIQPEYEELISPLLSLFDLSPFFTALIERLEGLKEELNTEIDRVDVSYQQLRRNMPSLSISVDVGISF